MSRQSSSSIRVSNIYRGKKSTRSTSCRGCFPGSTDTCRTVCLAHVESLEELLDVDGRLLAERHDHPDHVKAVAMEDDPPTDAGRGMLGGRRNLRHEVEGMVAAKSR